MNRIGAVFYVGNADVNWSNGSLWCDTPSTFLSNAGMDNSLDSQAFIGSDDFASDADNSPADSTPGRGGVRESLAQRLPPQAYGQFPPIELDVYEGDEPAVKKQFQCEPNKKTGDIKKFESSEVRTYSTEAKALEPWNNNQRFTTFSRTASQDVSGLSCEVDTDPTAINNVVSDPVEFTALQQYKELSKEPTGIPAPLQAFGQQFATSVLSFQAMQEGKPLPKDAGKPMDELMARLGVNPDDVTVFPQKATIDFGKASLRAIAPDPGQAIFTSPKGLSIGIPKFIGRDAYRVGGLGLSTKYELTQGSLLANIKAIEVTGDGRSFQPDGTASNGTGVFSSRLVLAEAETVDRIFFDAPSSPLPPAYPQNPADLSFVPSFKPSVQFAAKGQNPPADAPEAERYVFNNELVSSKQYFKEGLDDIQFGDAPIKLFQQSASARVASDDAGSARGDVENRSVQVSLLGVQVPHLLRNFGQDDVLSERGRQLDADQPAIRYEDITPGHESNGLGALAEMGTKKVLNQLPPQFEKFLPQEGEADWTDRFRDVFDRIIGRDPQADPEGSLADPGNFDIGKALGVDYRAEDYGKVKLVPVDMLLANLRHMSYANPQKYGAFEHLTTHDVVDMNPGSTVTRDGHPYAVAGQNLILPVALVADTTKPEGSASSMLALSSTTGRGFTGVFDRDGLAQFNDSWLDAKATSARLEDNYNQIRKHVVPYGEPGLSTDWFEAWAQQARSAGHAITDRRGEPMIKLPLPADYAESDSGALTLNGFNEYVRDLDAMLESMGAYAKSLPPGTTMSPTSWVDGRSTAFPTRAGGRPSTAAEAAAVFDRNRRNLEEIVAPISLPRRPGRSLPVWSYRSQTRASPNTSSVVGQQPRG